jgi:hypothetical protein
VRPVGHGSGEKGGGRNSSHNEDDDDTSNTCLGASKCLSCYRG